MRQPGELTVLINEFRKGTKGKLFTISDMRLMKRTQYAKLGNPIGLTLDLKNVPLEMYEARNAVDIARSDAARASVASEWDASASASCFRSC